MNNETYIEDDEKALGAVLGEILDSAPYSAQDVKDFERFFSYDSVEDSRKRCMQYHRKKWRKR